MAGTYIKPALVEAAWSAVRHPGRLQARYHALVRRMGGPKNPAARKKAIVAIAHTLLKIAWAVLKSGQPYEEPGDDFYARREDPPAARPGSRPRSRSSTPAAPSPSPLHHPGTGDRPSGALTRLRPNDGPARRASFRPVPDHPEPPPNTS